MHPLMQFYALEKEMTWERHVGALYWGFCWQNHKLSTAVSVRDYSHRHVDYLPVSHTGMELWNIVIPRFFLNSAVLWLLNIVLVILIDQSVGCWWGYRCLTCRNKQWNKNEHEMWDVLWFVPGPSLVGRKVAKGSPQNAISTEEDTPLHPKT